MSPNTIPSSNQPPKEISGKEIPELEGLLEEITPAPSEIEGPTPETAPPSKPPTPPRPGIPTPPPPPPKMEVPSPPTPSPMPSPPKIEMPSPPTLPPTPPPEKKPEKPPTPPTHYTMRTMEKDIEAIKTGARISEGAPVTPTEIARLAETVPFKTAEELKKKKILLILIISIIGVIIIGGGVFGYVYFLMPVPPPPPEEIPATPEVPEVPVTPPPAVSLPSFFKAPYKTAIIELLFKDKNSIIDGLITETLKTEAEGTIKQIGLKFENKLLTLPEFFGVLEINTPQNFFENFKDDPGLFLYAQREGQRLGLAASLKEVNATTTALLKTAMSNWESTMDKDLEPLLLRLSGERATTGFLDNIYKNISIRYVNFPDPSLSIDWTIYNGLLIITTSRDSMWGVIDNLSQ